MRRALVLTVLLTIGGLFVDFHNDFVTYVQTEKKAGKSVDQVSTAYRIPARYIGYYADPGRTKENVQGIFEGK